jgi:hypothetical protein
VQQAARYLLFAEELLRYPYTGQTFGVSTTGKACFYALTLRLS